MSLLWIQSLIVGILIYGIVIFIFGVRNFNDFVQFTAPLNKKKRRITALVFLILPPFIFASVIELIIKNLAFFTNSITLTVIGLIIALSVFIPYAKKIDWKLVLRRSNQRLRELITPLQFFLWFFLLLISVSLTWFLVGEFWIFNGYSILALFLVYMQMALIYFFGSYLKRRYIESQRKKGVKFTESPKFKVQQIHVFIFLSINIFTIFLTWFIVGDFWFFSKLSVVLIVVIYAIVSLLWGFGTIVWKKYILPMAESDSNMRLLLKTFRSHLTDIIAGVVVLILLILFFILRPMLQESFSPQMKMNLIIITVALIVIYLFAKYIYPRLSVSRFFIYLGLSVDPLDKAVISDTGLKSHHFKVLFTWLIFLAYSLISSLFIYLMIEWREIILDYFNLNSSQYFVVYNIFLILSALIYIFNDLDKRLSGLNHEVAHKRYYINKKRKFLMIELEEIQNQINEERQIKDKLEEDNVRTAIELLKSKGYQIIIGPDTRMEDAEKA